MSCYFLNNVTLYTISDQKNKILKCEMNSLISSEIKSIVFPNCFINNLHWFKSNWCFRDPL